MTNSNQDSNGTRALAAANAEMAKPPVRLASVDVYRGFVIFLMWTEVMRFDLVSQAHPSSAFWKIMLYHGMHVPWAGGSLHDLIQPGFAFIAGVSLTYSIASRKALGQPSVRVALHAFWRALLLVLLGVFLSSNGAVMTNWIFDDTLSQIGLGYGFLFLLGFRSTRFRWAAFVAILVGYWSLFAMYPLPGPDFDWVKAGTSPDWPSNLTGFAAHWNGNTNVAWAFDVWFLNLFPRSRPFTANAGGICTLNFIPMIATMILGLHAGDVLRNDQTAKYKLRWYVVVGGVCIAAGWLLGALGICPIVKRIWTPSWVLYSGGWCLLFLAAFYGVIDVAKRRAWAFPFRVMGMNSIAAYCMWYLFDAFFKSNLKTHFGQNAFKVFGESFEPLILGAAVLVSYWLILYWMYRRNVFLRI